VVADPKKKGIGMKWMKRIGWLAMVLASAAVVSMAGSACCHVNNLREHLPGTQRVLVVPLISGGPTVQIEAPRTSSKILNVVGAVAAVATAVDGYDKITQAAAPERMAAVLQQAFAGQVTAQLKLQPVSDPQQPHDAELHVEVSDYGIRQLGPHSPLEYFFHAEARLIRVPDGELIWRDCEGLAGPLSPVIVFGPSGAAATANTMIGIAALAGLEPEELAAMFDRIADDAGRILAQTMVRDSVD
jgi:hypothetical protein